MTQLRLKKMPKAVRSRRSSHRTPRRSKTPRAKTFRKNKSKSKSKQGKREERRYGAAFGGGERPTEATQNMLKAGVGADEGPGTRFSYVDRTVPASYVSVRCQEEVLMSVFEAIFLLFHGRYKSMDMEISFKIFENHMILSLPNTFEGVKGGLRLFEPPEPEIIYFVWTNALPYQDPQIPLCLGIFVRPDDSNLWLDFFLNDLNGTMMIFSVNASRLTIDEHKETIITRLDKVVRRQIRANSRAASSSLEHQSASLEKINKNIEAEARVRAHMDKLSKQEDEREGITRTDAERMKSTTTVHMDLKTHLVVFQENPAATDRDISIHCNLDYMGLFPHARNYIVSKTQLRQTLKFQGKNVTVNSEHKGIPVLTARAGQPSFPRNQNVLYDSTQPVYTTVPVVSKAKITGECQFCFEDRPITRVCSNEQCSYKICGECVGVLNLDISNKIKKAWDDRQPKPETYCPNCRVIVERFEPQEEEVLTEEQVLVDPFWHAKVSRHYSLVPSQDL